MRRSSGALIQPPPTTVRQERRQAARTLPRDGTGARCGALGVNVRESVLECASLLAL